MDFTVKIYKELLKSLQNAGYTFKTFEEYLKGKEHFYGKKTVVLRHDVDALPENSMRFAQIQAEMGIFGTYYFRNVPQSWNEEIITEISSMGHEVGYHYENMDIAFKKLVSSKVISRGDAVKITKDLEALSVERRKMSDERIEMSGERKAERDKKSTDYSLLVSHLSPLTSHLSPLRFRL